MTYQDYSDIISRQQNDDGSVDYVDLDTGEVWAIFSADGLKVWRSRTLTPFEQSIQEWIDQFERLVASGV